MEILFLFLGILLGAIAIYIIVKPKLKSIQQMDEETLNKNEQLRADLLELSKDYSSLSAKKEEILASITTLKKQAEETSNALYEKSYDLANERMSQAAENMSQEYNKAKELAHEEYIKTIKECVNSFQNQIKDKLIELEDINSKLADLSAKVNAAVEASKRAEEIKTKQDFYKLQLSTADIEEIKHLRSVIPHLRNSEPLNKVIWKVYYEKPYTDLIGRVVGTGTHTGIYKITNIENQMCYVGQAVNISDRFKQHIKRGIGAETPTRNKLYPAMLEFGVENFTFEIIEEVERSKLNERESYWQEYFHAKDFGYSIK